MIWFLHVQCTVLEKKTDNKKNEQFFTTDTNVNETSMA